MNKENKINITFPDGKVHSYNIGISCFEIAENISQGFARNQLVASLNDKLVDLSTKINKDSDIMFYGWDSEIGKSTFWHSSAHLMAEALESLFSDIKFGIGPPIENGFYYDVDFGKNEFKEEDKVKLENKILELAKQKSQFFREEVSKKNALKHFNDKGDNYKIDLINDLNDGEITFYKQGNFIDLCKGPHLPNTKLIKSVKILNIAGAYWRGDEKGKQLTRIYGISFPNNKELSNFLLLQEEAKKRDHRKIGKELELFTFSEKVGQGLPLWLPNGTIVRECLIDFMKKEQIKEGYLPVVSPHIGSKDLYVTSGHYDKYGESSFQPIKTPNENEEFFLKPMNCPHHCEIYKSKPRSYKNLPLRLAEFGSVYRYEQSGELHGLTRVRGFTQDDAHIFCTNEQVKSEFIKVIDLILKVFDSLSFDDYSVQVSLRDKEDKSKYIGTDKTWEMAENDILEAVKEKKIKYSIEYGEAAFYGPKLDFMVKDSLNRKWQLGTIQVDYQLPERFQLDYITENNTKQTPVVIHRAPFGSLERFVALLTEHCYGNFPFWLAPIQMTILSISDKFNSYSDKIFKSLSKLNLRVIKDIRSEKISKKIRDAELKKIPYMIIIGENELKSNKISLRKHTEGDLGKMTLDDLISILKKEKNVIINN